MKVRLIQSAWGESEAFLKECDLSIGNVYEVLEVNKGSVSILDDKDEPNILYIGEYVTVEENAVEQ